MESNNKKHDTASLLSHHKASTTVENKSDDKEFKRLRKY
jgi:hypothetical protein